MCAADGHRDRRGIMQWRIGLAVLIACLFVSAHRNSPPRHGVALDEVTFQAVRSVA